MKDKKLQVFVSSTFTDLREERQAAVEAILSSGNIPAGMELFAAGDQSQMTVIKRWIDESDVYLLILGGRYGAIEPSSGKSYTHLEFEYALETKKALFSIVISEKGLNNKVSLAGRSVLEDENPKDLKNFKSLVQNNLVKFWEDNKDIKLAIYETLNEFSLRKELIGWVRGDNVANSSQLADELARLSHENSELRFRISKITQPEENKYSNISYSKLVKMLLNESKIEGMTSSNLFDLFMHFGDEMALGMYRPVDRHAADRLCFYRLLREGDYDGYYAFTKDGYDFFLETISRNLDN